MYRQSYASASFVYTCEIDLGLTYSLSRPKLAARCFLAALDAAIRMGAPRDAARANELLAIVGA